MLATTAIDIPMTEQDDSRTLFWPASELAEAVEILCRKAGMLSYPAEIPVFPDLPDDPDESAVGRRIEQIAGLLGIEAEPVESSYADIEEMIARSGPALFRIPESEPPQFLAVLKGGNRRLSVIAADMSVRRVPLKTVRKILTYKLEAPLTHSIDKYLERAGVPEERRERAAESFLSEQLGTERIRGCWLLRFSPGADFFKQVLHARLPRYLAVMIGLHIIGQILMFSGWWIIGQSIFKGHFEWVWLSAWALIMFTGIPLQLIGIRAGTFLSVGFGALFKKRLLYGTLKLEPDEIRHQGAGQFLGRVMESESLDSMVLGSGFTAGIAVIDLVIAGYILWKGVGGPYHIIALLLWCFITFFICWLLYRHVREMVETYREMTYDLVERMVAHRTRLAQEDHKRWHDDEDRILNRYLNLLEDQEGISVQLKSVISRGWLITGLSGIAFAFVTGSASQAELAVSLGGIMLAAHALSGIAGGITGIVGAKIAWEQAGPLFRAGTREKIPPRFFSVSSENKTDQPDQGMPLMLLKDIVFRYREHGRPILRESSLKIHKGDRILLEGPSGGGKSTLISIMAGLNVPESGLLLLQGADRQTLGHEAWRKRVATAPQFHENHILTETFSFNLLMGREWPPCDKDLEEAETVCREMGLGDLLDRMPAGFQQMVGESGWRLSHGERSRLYIARAILQKADLIILDESFAALDPENLHLALSCVIGRANTLLVIAHP